VGVGCWCGTGFACGGLAVVQVVVGEVVAGGCHARVGGCCYGHFGGGLVLGRVVGCDGERIVSLSRQSLLSYCDGDDRS
jgi:hypothetical protein